MHPTETILGLLLPCAAVAILIILVPVLAVVFLAAGGRRHRDVDREAFQVAQEIHANLARMEKRIEALEEILLGRGKER